MHDLAVYVKNPLCFRLAWRYSVSYFFFLCLSVSSSLCTVFDDISSNIDEVLSINLSSNVFIFGEISVHRKGRQTYSSGTDRPSEPCYNFCLNWPYSDGQLSYSDHSLWLQQFWSIGFISFFLILVFVISVSIYFPSNSKGDVSFHHTACDYFRAV